jgi:hypothetical protein
MRRFVCGLVLGVALSALPGAAHAAESPDLSFNVAAPKFPTPQQMSTLGIALTAVAVVGARVSNRSSDTIMYVALVSLALTGTLVAYSDKLHTSFVRAGFEKLEQLQQQAGARAHS